MSLLNPFDLYYGCMRMIKKALLTSQIDVYLSWTERSNVGSGMHREWLYRFRDFTNKEDILDVTKADVEAYLKNVYNSSNTSYELVQAKRAMGQLMKFYMARSKNGKAQLGRGRPPKVDVVLKAYELRQLKTKKGTPMFSYRQIGRILHKDVGHVFKMVKMALKYR